MFSYIFFVAKYLCVDGLVQNCSISIANALEILQSCSEPTVLSYDYIAYMELEKAEKGCGTYSLTWYLLVPLVSFVITSLAQGQVLYHG